MNYIQTHDAWLDRSRCDKGKAREFLHEHEKRTGESLSFTAFITDCVGKAVDEQKVCTGIWAYGHMGIWAYGLTVFFDQRYHDEPVTSLEKVTAHSHASFNRGNTDRYVVTGISRCRRRKRCKIPLSCQRRIEAARSFSGDQGLCDTPPRLKSRGFFCLSSVRDRRSNVAWPRLIAHRSGGGKARHKNIHSYPHSWAVPCPFQLPCLAPAG